MRTPGDRSDRRPAERLPSGIDGSDLAFVDAYLNRIRLSRTDVFNPDLDAQVVLERVVRAQAATVPFENLMIHAGQIVDVDPLAITRKILGDKHGGICYEVNGLLARALQDLGFTVRLVGAAVARDSGEFGPALAHMAVIATRDDRHWLVDTGFGGSSVLMPISGDQIDRPIDVRTATGSYRTDGMAHRPSDFADIARWHSTSPASRFTGSIICSITDDTHRITMSRGPGEQFVLTRTDLATGERDRNTVTDDAVRATFADRFGISLQRPPDVAEFD